MKKLLALGFFLGGAGIFVANYSTCSFAKSDTPERLVVIKGIVTILNHPDLGKIPDSGRTIIFQKVGCNSCYVGTNADADGKYKIMVDDGKYKIIARNPSSPEIDLLAPDQEKFIDTESDEAKKESKQVFDLDIDLELPEE